ncbi:MAG: Nramp family divalent metal transporter [Candidatus Peregrinibacteria bacterium]
MPKSLLQRIVEAPAAGLGRTINSSRRLAYGVGLPLRKAGQYWKTLGPGLTTGAADDDPSGIATYSQTGAQYGFQLLWMAAYSFPLMALIQEMCARIGLVTGRGLAGNIRHRYPRWVLHTCTILLVCANTFNIGADLGSMAQATQLLLPGIPATVLILFFAILILGLLIFSSYRYYARLLKWLAMILVAYIFAAFLVHPDWSLIARSSLLPTITFSREQLILICAILGTTISPYLFFWQTSQEVEEEIERGETTLKMRQQSTTTAEITQMRIDVWSGMFFSNLIMFFIIAACGAVLNKNGITNIVSAADAAEALRPLAGNAASLLFTVGIIGTGLLAIPVLAGSSSYALSESFGWRSGLDLKLSKALAFYGVIILSVLLGFLMNLIGLDPIKALIYSAVANGVVAPVMLAFVVLISGSRKIMKEHVNSPMTTFLGWLVTGLMVIAGGAALWAMMG